MSQTQPIEKRFTSQRLSLAYAEWITSDSHLSRPTILLVHGGRDQKRSWDDVARALSASYRVIAHDLRGHGKSDWVSDGEYGVMDHVFDLASLVQHLELDSFILIGHSLGGNIALRYTGLFPDKVTKLIALEGLGPSPKMLAERAAEDPIERLRKWVTDRTALSQRTSRKMADLETAKARMKAAFSHLKDEQIHHLTETGLRHNEDGTVSWAYDPAGMGRSPSDIPNGVFQQLWTKITCPTWLVYGANSWASNPEKDGRAKHFPTAKISVIDNAGHWIHHDQFDAFMSGLNAFLSE